MSAPDFASYSAKHWSAIVDVEAVLAERKHPPTETEIGVFYSASAELERLVADGLAVLADDTAARGQTGGQLVELTPAGWAVAHAIRRWQGEALDRSEDARAEAAAVAWVRSRTSSSAPTRPHVVSQRKAVAQENRNGSIPGCTTYLGSGFGV